MRLFPDGAAHYRLVAAPLTTGNAIFRAPAGANKKPLPGLGGDSCFDLSCAYALRLPNTTKP